MRRLWLTVGAATASVFLFAGNAHADGGQYSIIGGNQAQQDQVRQALNASAFDWDLVPGRVTIHIARGLPASYSTPGQTWLDARLLDAGTFSWGVVQMEYAQQVQFSLLDASARSQLTADLGAQQWCYENPSLPWSANACERFAATLAWAYWPSSANCLKPGPDTGGPVVEAASFRRLLTRLIGAPDLVTR